MNICQTNKNIKKIGLIINLETQLLNLQINKKMMKIVQIKMFNKINKKK